MGYKQTLSTKIIRRKHTIDFREGGGFQATRAGDMKKMLTSVPDEARVDEVVTDDEGGTIVEITFHEELISV